MRIRAGLSRLAAPVGVAGLVLAAFLVYLPSLDDFFAADDFVFLQAASRHDFREYVWRAVTFPHGEPFDLETPFWRPLVDAYFFAWWHLFGLDPLPYHLANVALHAAVAVLTAVLVWQLTGVRLTGLLAGFLFVVAPTHDYTVTWISDITELLAAFWYLVTLVAYSAFLRGGGRLPWLYAAALTATALSFLAKQSSVTVLMPLAGLVFLLGPPTNGRGWRRRLVELLPFAALTAGFVTLIATQEYPRYAAMGWYGLGGHMLAHWWDYLRWLTCPFGETAAASRQASSGLLTGMSTLTALAFLAMGVVAWRRRQALLLGMVLWTLAAFTPFLSATRPIEPRYAYLASVPLCIALALLVHSAASRLARRVGWELSLSVATAGTALIGLVLAAHTRERQHWIQGQAQAYERLVSDVPRLCGALPAHSQIYLDADPLLWDMFGGFSSMAFNLLYENVRVEPIPADDHEWPATQPGTAVCAVRYSAGRYTHLSPGAAGQPTRLGR